MDLKKQIREIPDFPEKGINFKDITTLLKNGDALNEVVDNIVAYYKKKKITKVVGLEARGFIFGGAIAKELKAGFVPIRKKGKLPSDTIRESYELEYGVDEIEMHSDALNETDVVLIHDDLLATGGTAYATLNLIKKIGVKEIYFSFVCDLTFIQTPKKNAIREHETQILIEY